MLLSSANLKKTINYCKKNGIKAGFYAVLERIEQRGNKYAYVEPAEEELEAQKLCKLDNAPRISIIVPAYETKPIYMEDLVLAVEEQSYANYQLIIADASESDTVEKLIKNLNEQYGNIEYYRLKENAGISGNSNAALTYVNGDYVALLDHDDLITADALFEVAEMISKSGGINDGPVLVYTDEDKTNSFVETYYEPNIKGRFNYNMLLTNNYICHLSVFKTEVLKELTFRDKYDGAQDYDLILRTVKYCQDNYGAEWKKKICHVPKVLYHWRCHEDSTAQNPESKMYAYEAGKRALQDHMDKLQVSCRVEHLKHLGFYRIEYDDIFACRKDIGVIGGPIYRNNRIVGGAMNGKGEVTYKGLRREYSGVCNRASLVQDADVVDIRNIIIRPKYKKMYKEATGFEYGDAQVGLLQDEDAIKKSIVFCNKVRKQDITILYDPQQEVDKFEN